VARGTAGSNPVCSSDESGGLRIAPLARPDVVERQLELRELDPDRRPQRIPLILYDPRHRPSEARSVSAHIDDRPVDAVERRPG